MPLTTRSLALSASPASVGLVRAWVTEILTAIDRDDLVFAATLGVSELVTNAILHARPPLAVRVRGTHEHPRIEVVDHSETPPSIEHLQQGDNVTTFGRGLALVALNSSHWGWDTHDDGSGKTVWFQPSATMNEHIDFSSIFDDPTTPVPAGTVTAPRNGISIVLLHTPTRLFGQLRRYHFELRRELRLLALSAPDAYPVAVQVSEVFERADAELRAAAGVHRLDSAIAQGTEHVDLEYVVPPSVPGTMAELLQGFADVRKFFAEEHLLAVTPTEVLQNLQYWYFNEFVRQGAGAEPVAWSNQPARQNSTS